MASVSNNQVIEIFKRVYGETYDLVPDDQQLSKDIEWVDGDRTIRKRPNRGYSHARRL